MPREFNVPSFYRSRSSGITQIKQFRKHSDRKQHDLAPTILDFGPVRLKIPRHFGFCFGVENAIEIAYRALEENPGRRVFLLSEMIHNSGVNDDLRRRGVSFLMDTSGQELIDFATLSKNDIVIVPAFGTTLEIQARLAEVGIDPYSYDTTCPFVEKVWKRAASLGADGYTVIVHGKRSHEETRATFSHSRSGAPTLVILDMKEAQLVCRFIDGTLSASEFKKHFKDCCSEGFDPEIHLQRVGVVNQTTMLATETKAISQAIRNALIARYGEQDISAYFADTRDTLCYATYENQSATLALLESGADIAIVVGGYNSSNTSHLVELLEHTIPTFFIKDADELEGPALIRHFDIHKREVVESGGWLPEKEILEVAIVSGASCPDSVVDAVIEKLLSYFPIELSFGNAVSKFYSEQSLEVPPN